MLLAGGGGNSDPLQVGIFRFLIDAPSSEDHWAFGSAIIKFDMLVAGGSADSDIFVGPFAFGIHVIPLFGHPFHGSASKITMDKQIQPLINLENTSVRSYAPIF